MPVPFQKHFSLLRNYVAPHRWKVFFIILFMFLNVGIKVINPMIIRFYLDSVSKVTDIKVMQNASLLFITMAVVQEGIYIFNVYLSADLAWLSTNTLRLDLFKHTIALDMSYHNLHKPGEMIERVDGDVNAISNFLSVFFLMVMSNLLLIVGILGAVFWTNLTMGVMFTLLVLLTFVLMFFARLISIDAWKKSRESTSELMGHIEETLGGTEDIKANAGEPHVFHQFHSFSQKEYSSTLQAVFRSKITDVVAYFAIGLGTTLIFAIGVPMVQDRAITVGTLYLYTYYFSLLLDPIFQVLRQIQQLQLADASVDRINELMAITPSLPDTGTKVLDTGPVEVIFRDLYFAYHQDDFILKGISFNIPRGKTLGLIGKTGSGKSTISRLIFRLYDYQRGDILLNGISIKEYSLKPLRKDIAIVTQEVELFHASIRDNITFFNPDIAEEDILSVLQLIGMDGWLAEQPEGLDTVLTKSGLSAGQAQLIAFARAFLEKPKLVILDEASSRLDPATESLVERAMSHLLSGRTGIVIAHRLETLKKVDLILLIENGEIIEYGERSQLERDPDSQYSRLLRIGLEEVLT